MIDLDAGEATVHTRPTAAGYAAVDTFTGDDALTAPDVGAAVRVSDVLKAAAR